MSALGVRLVKLAVWFVFAPYSVATSAATPIDAEGGHCLTKANLKKLDAQYELAIKNADTAFLAQLLTTEFVWVHNLAVMKESKAMLLARLQSREYEKPLSRKSDIQQIQLMQTVAVVSGISTVVKQDSQKPNEERFNAYQFMRTYVLEDNRCQLLAVQTMKLTSGLWPKKEAGP